MDQQAPVVSVPAKTDPNEVTKLSPLEETIFKSWAKANGIDDVDDPESHYDYRGFFKASGGKVHPPGSVEHFPDTFKQHGHPTFSIESQYSKGPFDGGLWAGNHFIQPMKMDPSHLISHLIPNVMVKSH